jgi:hypothetical protein
MILLRRFQPTPALLLAAALFLSFAQLRAQDSGSPSGASIILGTVAGDRGAKVTVPVYFRPGNTPLSHAAFSVDFISNSVKFENTSTEGSLAADSIKIRVDTEPLAPDPKGLPRTRLKITADSPSPGGPGALPEGLWIFLNFALAADAKPFAVTLLPSEEVATNSAGLPQKLTVEPGKVIVSAEDETVLGCFFFTH